MPVSTFPFARTATGTGCDIHRIAVLGAGTMGARIAALFANAGFPVLLLDVADLHGNDRSRIARQAVDALERSRPAVLVSPAVASLIQVGNFEDDLPKLANTDWIVEAVIEKLEAKRHLLSRLIPHLNPRAVLTTNTSGLPVAAIAAELPLEVRRRWFGTHFFNPPRYMALFEAIPTRDVDRDVFDAVVRFAEVHLGKTVVPAKDSPSFIANRIGIFALMNAMRIMQRQGLSIEEIDALTGAALGWPKTGTFRLTDLVGLDVVVHVARNFAARAEDERKDVVLASFMERMLELKWLGDKTGQGFYKKVRGPEGKEQRLVLNLNTFEYEASREAWLPELATVKSTDPAPKRITALLGADPASGRTAAFYWEFLPDLWAYAANRIGEVSDSIADIDLAMQAGFNWQLGPFALWDAAGVGRTVATMRGLGKPVPAAAERLLEAGEASWYRNDGSEYFDPDFGGYRPVRSSPRVLSLPKAKTAGVVLENSSCSLVDLGDGVGCIELHSKMNTLGRDVVLFIQDLLGSDHVAANRFNSFVICNDAANFSVGANLAEAMASIEAGDWAAIETFIRNFQAMTQAVKFCSRPVVAAPFGMCLGGGAEVSLHAASRQAHMEVAMGLVETGVGLIPGGGGCKEMTLRALHAAFELRNDGRADSHEVQSALGAVFETIAMAKVSTSAVEARELKLLRSSDRITMNRSLLLADAKAEARRLAATGYTPPIELQRIPAPGKPALALLELKIHLLREGEFIGDHDAKVARLLAKILSGGPVAAGTLVSESYLLDLEREAFLSLCGEKKTQDRIAFTLKTGKRLRN